MEFPEHIYMVGIGGIGMSALAQMLIKRGRYISGSDRSTGPTTELLESIGVSIAIGHGSLPEDCELLIYSDAIGADNPERVEASVRNVPQMSYFQALGEISTGLRTIAVAGTHGKTTTTGMLTKILVDAGESPKSIIGSIVRDFGTNYVDGKSDLFVVEACEYRDHLLELSPEILIITNIEHDHTDFFPSLKDVQRTFRRAAESVPPHGVIIANPSDHNVAPVLENVHARVIDYTQKAVGELQLVGEFNRENARAALAAALAVAPHITPEAAVHSLSQFQGSWRRFEYKGMTKNGALVYDDYGHHPTEVKKTIQAAKEKFPDKQVIVAFHPHLYSRTKDLFDDFVDALASADAVVLAPIFAARESDPGDMSSDILAEAIAKKNEHVLSLKSFPEIVAELESASPEHVIITMGAGDIYKVAEEMTQG